VRPTADGSGTFGVWDGAVNGWRASGLVDEAEAHRLASDLDVQYDAHRPRPADAVHLVKPSQPVQRVEWRQGEVDVWIRFATEDRSRPWLQRFGTPAVVGRLGRGGDSCRSPGRAADGADPG
jgi:hypothetical protein